MLRSTRCVPSARPYAINSRGIRRYGDHILREAEWYATWDEGDSATLDDSQRGENDMLGGHHLGPMASVIVLETFLALLNADPSSFVHQAGWRPMAPIARPGADFLLEDMVRWALT